jgi:hypothetical protein
LGLHYPLQIEFGIIQAEAFMFPYFGMSL